MLNYSVEKCNNLKSMIKADRMNKKSMKVWALYGLEMYKAQKITEELY